MKIGSQNEPSTGFPHDPLRSSIAVAFPHSSIGLLCQSEQSVKKRIALAVEESRIRQKLSYGRRSRQR